MKLCNSGESSVYQFLIQIKIDGSREYETICVQLILSTLSLIKFQRVAFFLQAKFLGDWVDVMPAVNITSLRNLDEIYNSIELRVGVNAHRRLRCHYDRHPRFRRTS